MTTPFGSLQLPGQPLVLANAWDAASARISEMLAGVAAVGTTSAGIAPASGVPTAMRSTGMPRLLLSARIVAAVTVAVSADLEAGYGEAPGTASLNPSPCVTATGAAGVNLEDAWHGGPLAAAGTSPTSRPASPPPGTPVDPTCSSTSARTPTCARSASRTSVSPRPSTRAPGLPRGGSGRHLRPWCPGTLATIEALVKAILVRLLTSWWDRARRRSPAACLARGREDQPGIVRRRGGDGLPQRAAREVLATGTYDVLNVRSRLRRGAQLLFASGDHHRTRSRRCAGGRCRAARRCGPRPGAPSRPRPAWQRPRGPSTPGGPGRAARGRTPSRREDRKRVEAGAHADLRGRGRGAMSLLSPRSLFRPCRQPLRLL